jgi:hypothetical protein
MCSVGSDCVGFGSSPDRHQNEKSDPDQHLNDAGPQHWSQHVMVM